VQRSGARRRDLSVPGERHTRRFLPRAVRPQLSVPLRAAVLTLGVLLWLSGAGWLVLHFGFPQHGPFGLIPNPREAPLLQLHGVIAVGAVFLLGWITATHILQRWASARQRISGLLLAGSALLLILSGYALYYSTGTAHDLAALAHEWVGGLAALVAFTHWRRARALR